MFSQGPHRRKRFTDDASASRVAEADEIWHSTAVEDSRINQHLENVPEAMSGTSRAKEVGRKRSATLQENNTNSRGSGRGPGDYVEEAPVIINPGSGHPFLSSVLQKCGYVIRQPATNNQMYVDVMKFRKKLSDWLVENDELKRIETDTSKFYKALDLYLSDKDAFVSSMKPTKHETELIQPSLLHLLLGIEALQPHVLKGVMPVLAEASLSPSEEDASLINTILNQLKWVPVIVDGKKFTENLLSIIDTAVFTCQSLMIKFIPDILPATLHLQVSEKLLEKFGDEGLQLNIPLMDCFSSLDIPEGNWSNIRATAIDQMSNASLRDIPAYFSFLFRDDNVTSLNETISSIREKVSLVPEGTNRSSNFAYQVEILEKITFSITVNPEIAKVWTKQIKDDLQHSVDQLKKIDLLMLMIFVDTHKPALPVMKLFFGEKNLAISTFRDIMQENHPMISQLFPTIARIFDSLLRVRDSKCLEAVCEMMVGLFFGLGLAEAQTLMGNMTSILINNPPSRDVVLVILKRLSEEQPSRLLLFAPHLMSVLEYVMQFPARQIKELMNILAVLSQTEGRHGTNHFNSEFSILLRKQLTHSNIKIRCFGVFGALASVRRMAEQSNPDEAQMEQLVKLAWKMVERDEDACSIFFDELAACSQLLPENICKLFRDDLKNKFQALWTLDSAEDSISISQYKQKKSLNLTTAFDANKEMSEDRILVAFENKPLEMSPLVMPAHLRVLGKLESKLENTLEGIDAILGCPLLFPSLDGYYLRDSLSGFTYNQRLELGQYLVLAINFFRESVNTFIHAGIAELRIKVWVRLENLLKLQKLLVKDFDSFPSLPHAYVAEKTIGFSKDCAGPSGFRQASATTSKAAEKKNDRAKKSTKKKPRREREGSDLENDEDEDLIGLAAPINSKRTSNINWSEEIQPKKLTAYLRRFDEAVFQLLRYPIRSDENEINFSNVLVDLTTVSQSETAMNNLQKVNPETLILILTELKQQINDEGSQLKILGVKKILKYICTHINNINELLVSREESDDDSGVSIAMELQLECCLRLLIEILSAYTDALKKLGKQDRDQPLAIFQRVLAKQARLEEREGTSDDIMTHVASYLIGLVSIIKNPATALEHMKLLKNVHDVFGGHQCMKDAIGSSASVYLQTDWKLSASQVDGFLKIWLGTSADSVRVIKKLARELLSVDEGRKPPNSSTFKSCTDANFHVWYSAMISGLSHYAYKNLRRRGDFEDSMKSWIQAVDIFKSLVGVAKLLHKNVILVPLLKNCRLFLEAFISGGAILLPQFWKEDAKRAQTFCRDLQMPCRTIQYICEHSKVHTDLQLLKSVPLVKRVLETMLFRVREVLVGVAVGATNVFCLGALKHRSLKGDCINSQIVPADELSSSSDDDDVMAAPLSGLEAENEEEREGRVEEDSMDIDYD